MLVEVIHNQIVSKENNQMIQVVFQGGLGNQIYQLSLALFLMKKGYKVSLDARNYIDEKSFHEGFSLEQLFDLSEFEIIRFNKSTESNFRHVKNKIPIKLKKTIRKIVIPIKPFYYNLFKSKIQLWDEEMFSKIGSSVINFVFDKNKIYNLKGYWQDESMVDQVNEDLSNLLFKDIEIKSNHQQLIQEILNTESVLIHFRGGDFLSNNNKYFDILTKEYYQKSISYIETITKKPHYFIYYDDKKQMERLLPDNIVNHTIVGKLSDSAVYDFNIQRMHKFYICSNSTFSWWSAKLSTTKTLALIPEVVLSDRTNDRIDVTTFNKMN